MSIVTYILGESGRGKSYSLKHLDPSQVTLIKIVAKPLPFKAVNWRERGPDCKDGNVIRTDSAADICTIIVKSPKPIIIIDDFQYLMVNEFMNRSHEKGYDKFNDIGRKAFDVVTTATNKQGDSRIYILAHTGTNDQGRVGIKTIGKMLDDKVTLEGYVTIVLRADKRENEYFFRTQNDGYDTTKSPEGLFEGNTIPNDLNFVDESICAYYGIQSTTKKEIAA